LASTTFPIAQSGSFRFVGSTVNLSIQRAALVSQAATHDVTGTQGGIFDPQKNWVQGLVTGEIYAEGTVIVESTGVSSLSQDNALSTAATEIAINPQLWTLRKSWGPLKDVTGSGDKKKQWSHVLASVTGSVSGNATAAAGSQFDGDLAGGGPIVTTVTFVIDNFGTLATAVVIEEKKLSARFGEGGPIEMSFAFKTDGAASSWTPTDSNYTWLFPSSAKEALGGDPPRNTLTLDIGADANISESAILYDCTLISNAATGGEVKFQARFRYD